MSKPLRGIFGILVTPFDDDGAIDELSVGRLVDFCVEGGAHGLVTPVISSEFHTLSDAERRRVLALVIERAAGRVPVVAGVSGVSVPVSLDLAREAVALGAEAVIATPPYLARLGAEGCFAFYSALHAALPADLPIVIQNAPPPLGTPMAPPLIARIAREHPRDWYVKQETLPSTHEISAVLNHAGDYLAGVFGGSGGRYVVDELCRGAVGLMSACHLLDVQRRLYDAYVAGDEAEAREIFARLLPIQTIWAHLGIRVAKGVLRRRGVIRSSATREPCPLLDARDAEEIEWAMGVLEAPQSSGTAESGKGRSRRDSIAQPARR